ncbi:MAG: hypothetical protein COB59_11065 [Rhodospirillaceae bacterium]|nr:MAG: hypothetical protein COB59_11065 [Rhodospirillaceae bacterium]
MSNDERVDHRTEDEIKAAQRGLLKILGFATFVPVVWVVLLAYNGYTNIDQAPPGDEIFVQFIVTWGLLSPFVWMFCFGYTFFQVSRGNMSAGRFLPLIPAFWIIFWFIIQFVRQSDFFM